MKKFFLFRLPAFAAVTCFACFAYASQQSSKTNSILLLSSTENESVIKFTMKEYEMKSVTTPWGEQKIVTAENTTPLLVKGAPHLPKFAASVVIPDNAKMNVQVVSSSYTDYPNIEIAPSKGNFTRDISPKDVPFIKGPEYSQNAFFPNSVASLREPYILRDFRGQTVLVNPFQYNPVSKTLRVYSEIIVKVFQSGTDGNNTLSRTAYPAAVNREFSHIYESHFLNYKNGIPSINYTPVGEFGKILIISHSSYMSAMQPYVDWKTRMGYQVTMVDVATAGSTSSAIKTYIQNQYNAGGLAFVLLVGDAAQVPTRAITSGDSDNDYAYIVGSDKYPDLLIGRFSAENTSHVTTQVDRIINYEKFPQASGTWYSRGVGIASDEGPGDDNEYDWQHSRNIRTKLLGYNYTSVDELYDGSHGGNDAPGNPTSSMLSTIVNNGVSVVNYTGHGSQTSWVTTGFSNTSVNALNNANKCPFVWSVGCVNGDFNGITCFAETWLRATDNSGAPAGALSMMASTINQSWNPPMEAQDEFNDILTESYANNIKRTFGGLSVNGCAKMNDSYGSQGTEMTDTWVLFGDPSVVVRTATPTNMTVSHVPQEYVGVTQLVVNCNTPGALVGLSVGGTWLGSGFVNNGNATITFPAISSACTIDVTVTAYNKMPYFGTVPVLQGTGIETPSGNISSISLHPNPAVSHCALSFTLKNSSPVQIAVFDLLGNEVAALAEDKMAPAGASSVKLDVSNLQKGIYFCRVKALHTDGQAGETVITRKLIVGR